MSMSKSSDTKTCLDLVDSCNTWTYFVQSEDGGPIKIGFTSKAPEERLCQLQTGSPTKLRIVGLIPQDREKELHVKFAKHHSHGEWFRPVKQILEFIEKEASSHLEQRLAIQSRLELERVTVPVATAVRPLVSISHFEHVFPNDENLWESLLEYCDWDESDQSKYNEFFDNDESISCAIDEMLGVCWQSGSFVESIGVNSDAGLVGFICGPCNSAKRMAWLRELGELAAIVDSATNRWFFFALFWSRGRQIGIDLLTLACHKCQNNEHVFDPTERFELRRSGVASLESPHLG